VAWWIGIGCGGVVDRCWIVHGGGLVRFVGSGGILRYRILWGRLPACSRWSQAGLRWWGVGGGVVFGAFDIVNELDGLRVVRAVARY
jgi:hypothetical protein